MAGKAKIDPAVFDPALLSAVQQLIPPERVHAYIRDLDLQFRMVVDSAPNDATLRSRAHKVVSQAGMLGLARVSECAGRVEDACRAGSGRAAALLQCREAIADIRLYAMPAAGVLAGDAPAGGI